ncbi:MAG: VOC family protein [Ktedonobacteraceae bacterium]
MARSIEKHIGNSPTIVFKVDNCRGTCATLNERGVMFVDTATETPWGVQAVFKDLYGNQFVLLERSW